MRKNALAKLLVAFAFASVMPLVTIACSGNDPLLGFRQPNPPRPDTGRDSMMQEGSSGDAGEGGEGGEASMDGASKDATDSMAVDTGVDTGIDTGVDAPDD